MRTALKVYFEIVAGIFLFSTLIILLLLFNTKTPSLSPNVDSSASPILGSTAYPFLFAYFDQDKLGCVYSKLGNMRYFEVDEVDPPALTIAEMNIITDGCYSNNRLLFHQNYFGGLEIVKPQIRACWEPQLYPGRYSAIRYNGAALDSSESEKLGWCYLHYSDNSTPNNPPPDTTTPPPSTTENSSTTPTYSTIGERYPTDSPKRACIEGALANDFAWFNNTANPNATKEYDRFNALEEKAKSCFETYPPPASTYEPKFYMAPELISCLKSRLGETRFNEISYGKSSPTPLDGFTISACYKQFYNQERPEVEYSTSKNLDSKTQSCLETAVGKERYEAISSGKSKPTSQEVKKGKECFGAPSTSLAPPPVLKIDTQIKKCINQTIKGGRLGLINLGKIKPTSEERNLISACFKNINKVQLAFLPSPPEQMLFFRVDRSTVAITEAKTQQNSKGKEPVVTFQGIGLKNSLVDIYLFSDPIVVTRNTDANGVWTYNLDVPLEEGDHVAYVAAKTDSGAVRSEVFRFSVAQAAASSDSGGGLIVKSTNFRDQISGYLYWVVGVIVIGITGLIVILILKNRSKQKLTASLPEKPS